MRKAFGLTVLLTLMAGTMFCLQDANARKIRTNHKIRTEKSRRGSDSQNSGERKIGIIITRDSTEIWNRTSSKIRFYGFDKTANSNVESFFITNGTDSTLSSVNIDLIYLDMKGRQLHRRSVELNCDVPAGETLRQDIKSWDTQKSFYFHQSAKPRRQATPYDIKIELRSFSIGD